MTKKEYDKIYRSRQAEKIKQYRIDHKDRIRKQNSERHKNRLLNDPSYKLICNRRIIRSQQLRNKKFNKSLAHLGCSLSEWKNYLESKFDNKMTWNNYGSYWHLDEVIPCSAWNFLNALEQIACFHYLNSQPLESKANISKGGANFKDYTKEKEQFLMILRILDIL